MDYSTPPSRSPAREFRCFGQLPAKLLRRCNLPEFVHFGSFSRKKLTYPSVDKSWIDSLSTCDNDNRREFLGRFEKAIATVFFSQGLGKCEEAGLEVTSVWEMLTSKPAAKYCSLKQGILHQLLDIISSSKEERLIRTSVYVLLVLISEDQSVIEDIKRKDLHLCCLARALKTNIQEAVILIYMLKPTPSEIKDLELLPSLVEIACNPHPGYKQATLSLPLSPTAASISMIEILVTAFDYVPPLVPPLEELSSLPQWLCHSCFQITNEGKGSVRLLRRQALAHVGAKQPCTCCALSTSAAHCPRQQRDSFLEKKKFRFISGHFEKFRLLYEKRKVETHIWTL